ncbi:MAG: nuclear transport factor 2 family protein, partial [Granulosicoccus sp.]|nr:nuclear transport factor 2 family protein [Granulosicoccus sp.]
MTEQEQTEATRQVILRMEAALAANADDMDTHFHENFRWMGNQGCGTKNNLQAFRDHWQLPLRAAFTEREYKTERLVCEGDWASAF